MPPKGRTDGELPEELVELRDHHRERARDLLSAVRHDYLAAKREHDVRAERERTVEWFDLSPLDLPAGKALKGQPDDVLVSVFVTALTSGKRTTTFEVVDWLQRKRLPFEPADVELVLHYAISTADYWWFLSKIGPAVSAAGQLSNDELTEPIRALLKDALKEVEADDRDPQTSTRLRVKVRELLAGQGEIDLDLFDETDNWGKEMRRIAEGFRGADGLDELLLHLAKATTSKPSARWRKVTVEQLARSDRADELIATMLQQVPQTDVIVKEQFEFNGETFYDLVFLTDANTTIARGAVWSLLELDRPWRTGIIEELLRAGLANSHKLANACIYVLGELGDDEALALLSRTRAKVKDKGVLKRVDNALAVAAERAGLTTWQLRERLVPTLGLDGDGRREVEFDGITAVLAVEPPDRVVLTWRSPDGKVGRSAPASVKENEASELRALRSESKSLREGVQAERRRIEELFVDDASWSLDEWRKTYLGHPVSRALAQRLIWTFGSEAAIPLDPSELIRADGTAYEPDRAAEVRLWHPIDAPIEEIAAWRSFLLEREVLQPFKQAFREIYLLAPAERETGVYSNRFAGHIVRYPQTYALMKSRQWSIVALGPYDNEGGRNRRDFEGAGIRVEFWIDHVDEGWGELGTLSELASTDQVRFHRIGSEEPMQLAEVPTIVFSEAMRDVDLFVGVSSIASDPEWLDGGEDRFQDYWHRTSFGELSETADTRRVVLEALLPRLSIADRVAVDGKFLVVRGDLRTYKIHLGSANVLMEPNDEYLCIVPARRHPNKQVFLPFEEDSQLSVILSKAFLLASDSKIEDRTITAQIQRS